MPLNIEITTFLLGSSPKNSMLSIQEMDTNLINLRNGILLLESNLDSKIDSEILLERTERIAADAGEVAARAAADSLLDARLSNVETTYLKRDGTLPLTGNLNADTKRIIGLGYPVDQNDAASKAYVDGMGAFFSGAPVTISANITLLASDFPNASKNLYVLPSTSINSRTVTLPNPTTVPSGTKATFANYSSSTNISISCNIPGGGIRTDANTLAVSTILRVGSRATFVSDGSVWNMYVYTHKPVSTNMWNDGLLRINSSGETFAGKTIHLKSTSTDGNNGATVDATITTDGTFLRVKQNSTGLDLLSIEKSTGKVIQNTNAAITDSNQLVTKDHIDKNVTGMSSIINKVINSTYIKTNKDESKPLYPGLVAADFGNIVRYRLEVRGNVYTTLPEISTLGLAKRITLINISNDTLLDGFGFPIFAANASVTFAPTGTNKIVGLATSGFNVNGSFKLECGATVELVAVNSNEWMVVSHSDHNIEARRHLNPYTRLQILVQVDSNGNIETYDAGAGGGISNNLWTRPNNLWGGGTGIIVGTSKPSLGVYNISWINPNFWAIGETGIVAPMVFVTPNSGGAPTDHMNVKVRNVTINGCQVVITNDGGVGVNSPFVLSVFGGDV